MAETKTKPKKMIRYNDNDYSFDDLEKLVLGNYNNYASRFGYDKTKFMKDYLALTEMLRLIRTDPNASFETGRINFGGDYANEKGAYGKARNKSKHYTNPAWMILDTLQGMSPYEEPKPEKKKITRAKLQSEFKDLLGVSDINLIPESQRTNVLLSALDLLLGRYGNLSNPDYEFEDNYGADYFNNMFNNARAALGTSDTTDDDKYYLYTLFGLNSPTETAAKSEISGMQKEFMDMFSGMGFSNEMLTNAWNTNVAPKLLEKKLDEFFKKYGISNSSSSTSSSTTSSSTTSSSTTSSSSTSSGTNGSAGVAATSTNTNRGTKEDTDKGDKKTQKSKLALWMDDSGIKNGSYFNVGNNSYKRVGDTAKRQSRYTSNYKSYKNMPLAKAGMKLNYIRNIRKYGDGGESDGNPDSEGTGLIDYNENIDNALGVLGLSTMAPGTFGRIMRFTYPLLSGSKTIYEYNNDQVGPVLAATRLGQDLVNLYFGTRSFRRRLPEASKKLYSEAVQKHKTDFTEQKRKDWTDAKKEHERKIADLNKYKEDNKYDDIIAKQKKGETLTPEEQKIIDEVKTKNTEIDTFTSTHKDNLSFGQRESESRKALGLLRTELDKTKLGYTPRVDELVPGLILNGVLAAASPEEYKWNDYVRAGLPLATLTSGATLSNFKGLLSEELPSVGKALGETTTLSERFIRVPNWMKKLFRKTPPEGGAAAAAIPLALTGTNEADAQTIIPGSPEAQALYQLSLLNGMNDMYTLQAGSPVKVGGTTGMFQGFRTGDDGVLYGVGPNGENLVAIAPEGTSYGKYPEYLRRLRAYSDPETGRTVIPAEMAGEVMNDPELYNYVLKNGFTFSNTNYDNGEIKLTPNRNFVQRYFDRARGQLKNGEVIGGEYTMPAIVAGGIVGGTAAPIVGNGLRVIGNGITRTPYVGKYFANLGKGLTDPKGWILEEFLRRGLSGED